MSLSTSARTYARVTNPTPAGQPGIDLGRPQVERKNHATSPCPEVDGNGDLLPGYAWTGTAHDSPSTRAAASITIPNPGAVGSLACWYSEDFGATWNWHYAESLGIIGTYGAITRVFGTDDLRITSDRALLLGPLAVWSDTLTAEEQAGVQALGGMWSWQDVGGAMPPLPAGSAIAERPYPDLLVPPILASARLFRTDMSRSFREPLELAWPYSMEVVCNPDAQHTRIATIDIVHPDAIRPLIDYVYLEVFLRDAAGRAMRVPMGHYLCDVPERSYDGRTVRGRLVGYGGTLALAQATMGGPYTLPAGSDPAVAMVDVIAGAGIPRAMIDIPPSGILTTEDVDWYGGELRQAIATELAAMIAWYAPWPDGSGVMRSRPYDDYATVPPVAVIGTEPGQLEILDDIRDTRDALRMRNRITVRRIAEGQDPIVATAEITDYSHPLHPERLQQARNSTTPVILAETIDDGQVETQAAALAKARATLAQRASWYQTTRVTQVLDAAPDAHQVVELDVRHGLTPLYAGRWWRRAWTFRMRGPVAEIEAELNRTVGVA